MSNQAANPQTLQPGSQANTEYAPVPSDVKSSAQYPKKVRTEQGNTMELKRRGPLRFVIGSDGGQGLELLQPDAWVLFEGYLAARWEGDKIVEVLEKDDTTPPESQPQPAQPVETDIAPDNVPLDLRLVYLVDDKSGDVIYSLGTDQEKELVDGFIVADNPSDKNSAKVSANQKKDTSDMTDFYGVPSLMNENAYINLQAAGGKGNNKYLIDRENQPRFYDSQNQNASNLGASKTPTTTNIINWSNEDTDNRKYKFPYKYQDFVFCKWWQKVPNNYMITLRRYPYPVMDAVTSAAEARKELDTSKLYPVATMITYLGEEPGNKISSILGPIESGLRWKEVKADVWEVTTSYEPATVNNPAPGLAKVLGFISKFDANDAKDQRAPLVPIDPYSNGPYANRILGPVNVIDSTKARERGLEFKHEINIVFEYSLRSIGGVNTKAAALDIIGNILVMSSATASFWGGMNRFMPFAAQGALDPFLGGDAGRNAWIKGDPGAFFNSLKNQFTDILTNVSDLFKAITDDPIGGLAKIAEKGASEFMKFNTTNARAQIQGLHSILTGAPVGEWHLQVGNPFNPMMMIGNLICTGVKLEFSDELGPDDFPTEIKATISLEHGMPRDRDGIESMFNKGQGRIYGLPKGYDESFSSSSESAVDGSTTRNSSNSSIEAGSEGNGSRRALIRGIQSDRAQRPSLVGGDVAYEQRTDPVKIAKTPKVRGVQAALYSMGTIRSSQGQPNETGTTTGQNP